MGGEEWGAYQQASARGANLYGSGDICKIIILCISGLTMKGRGLAKTPRRPGSAVSDS